MAEHIEETPASEATEEEKEAERMWRELKDEGEPREDLLARVEEAEQENGGVAGRLEKMDALLAGSAASGKEIKPAAELNARELARESAELTVLLRIMEKLQGRYGDEVGIGMSLEDFAAFASRRLQELDELKARLPKQDL